MVALMGFVMPGESRTVPQSADAESDTMIVRVEGK
jgi:hypothetical protein